MRVFLAVTLGGLLMVGCGDDGGGGDAGSGGMGATGGTGGMGGGSAGLSVEVSWEPVLPCAPETASDYEITVVVENEVDPVTVMGNVVPLCTGAIDTVGVNTIECPNTGRYTGTVTVMDAVGSDQVQFMIDPCMSGSAP